jgi:hypothetical protein
VAEDDGRRKQCRSEDGRQHGQVSVRTVSTR